MIPWNLEKGTRRNSLPAVFAHVEWFYYNSKLSSCWHSVFLILSSHAVCGLWPDLSCPQVMSCDQIENCCPLIFSFPKPKPVVAYFRLCLIINVRCINMLQNHFNIIQNIFTCMIRVQNIQPKRFPFFWGPHPQIFKISYFICQIPIRRCFGPCKFVDKVWMKNTGRNKTNKKMKKLN